MVGVGDAFHNSTVVLKLVHWGDSTAGCQGVVPVQNRLKTTVARCGQVGVHEGLTLFEGSS
jgi:hypothetical protein